MISFKGLVCLTVTYSFLLLFTQGHENNCQLYTKYFLVCIHLTSTARSHTLGFQTHTIELCLLIKICKLLTQFYFFDTSLLPPNLRSCVSQVTSAFEAPLTAVFPRQKYFLLANHQFTHHTWKPSDLQKTWNCLPWPIRVTEWLLKNWMRVMYKFAGLASQAPGSICLL